MWERTRARPLRADTYFYMRPPRRRRPQSLARYYVNLKGAFRLYCLLGAAPSEPPGNGEHMGLGQFLRFVDECSIAKAGAQWASASSAKGKKIGAAAALDRKQVERVFHASNRELDLGVGSADAAGLPSNDENPDAYLMAHEFVQSLLRLARLRYGELIDRGNDPAPLSTVFGTWTREPHRCAHSPAPTCPAPTSALLLSPLYPFAPLPPPNLPLPPVSCVGTRASDGPLRLPRCAV